jgi:hypothetical protein
MVSTKTEFTDGAELLLIMVGFTWRAEQAPPLRPKGCDKSQILSKITYLHAARQLRRRLYVAGRRLLLSNKRAIIAGNHAVDAAMQARSQEAHMTAAYVVIGLIVLALIAGGITLGPDVVRYMKIRSM